MSVIVSLQEVTTTSPAVVAKAAWMAETSLQKHSSTVNRLTWFTMKQMSIQMRSNLIEVLLIGTDVCIISHNLRIQPSQRSIVMSSADILDSYDKIFEYNLSTTYNFLMTPQGDIRGRGLYLIKHFADQLNLNVHKSERA